MIKLVFTTGRETISIEIDKKIITYKDRRFPKGFQFMPIVGNVNLISIMSRNRIPKEIVELIKESNSGKNLEEYKEAPDDEALSVIIKRDAALKGCVFQKRIDL
jgi:hypothetical protein